MTLLVGPVIGVWAVAFLLLAALFLLKWKLPFLIGRSGEKFVSRKLLNLDPMRYRVLDDLMLPSLGNTNTTQIDHVVVSNFGIFCIETKSYSGWIFGNAQQQYWTQVIYRYKNKFYNPLRQNYAHIKAVEAILKPTFPQVTVCGFVAFPSADRLQISGTDSVDYATNIVEKIKRFKTPVLSDAERDIVVQMLVDANIVDKAVRQRHDRDTHALKVSSGF